MTELWDIYDIDRNKTGRTHERGKPLAPGDYHLVVHIWVRDPKGAFLITKRAEDKVGFPGCWECTGGSALAGETGLEAALRETLEETGLDHTNSRKTRMLAYTRDDWHGDVWLFETERSIEKIRLQASETTEARLVSKEEILKLYRNGDFCPYDYVEKLLSML